MALSVVPVPAQEEEVVLSEAEISAKRETAEHISAEQMEERGDTNLLEAIRWVPGIWTNNGHPGYDTGGFGLRGYGGDPHNGDHLALFIDGVPMIDHYEGRIDYNSVLTGGIESVDIAKGYNSVLLGPNNIGGTLLVRSARPRRLFELRASSAVNLDGGGYAGTVDSVTAGTRLGIFYGRAGFSGSFIDHWRLPNSFVPADTVAPELGGNPQKEGNRIFSGSTSLGANAMLGIAPFENLDIWTTYSFSFRDKDENPPPVGGTNLRIMAWPYERRHTAALHAEWTPPRFEVNFHGYFDTSESRQADFSGSNAGGIRWAAYQTWLDTGAGLVNDYEKYTVGATLGGGFTINDRNRIDMSLQFRQESETFWRDPAGIPEHTDDYKRNVWTDNLWYGAAEYTVSPFDRFTAVLGFGLDYIDPQEIYSVTGSVPYTPSPNLVLPDPTLTPQWTAALFYDLTEQHELHLTYAKKHRFASFLERNSYLPASGATSFTATRPNPDLKPVEMHHFEFGYKGYFLNNIRITAAVFTNYERNRIVRVQITGDPDYGYEYQNLDEFLYYGFEFGTEMFLNQYFTLGGAMGINKYAVLHSTQNLKYLGSTPQLTSNGYFSISPFAGIDTGIVESIRIMPRFEYVSIVDTGGTTAAAARTVIYDYALLHINITADIAENYSLSLAVFNLLDELYEVSQYHPGPGRSFRISVGIKF
ncbi:MAG: TonB-dependent receptor [Spirochaetales bacterium]|nr:TonB-dependent receptor [Spirochaetales bacterium]